MLNLSIRFRLALAYVRSSSFQRAIILTLNNVSVRLAVFSSFQLNQTHVVNYLNPDKGIPFLIRPESILLHHARRHINTLGKNFTIRLSLI